MSAVHSALDWLCSVDKKCTCLSLADDVFKCLMQTNGVVCVLICQKSRALRGWGVRQRQGVTGLGSETETETETGRYRDGE